MLQYSPKIITDSLVMCLDASNNKSYPTDLPVKGGLLLWLDAADDTTFSYSSGTEVSQWRDKSGNNFHANQSLSSAQPSRASFNNGRKSLNFIAANPEYFLISANSNLAIPGDASIFIVYKPTTQTNAYAVLLDNYHGQGGAYGFVIQRVATNSQFYYANGNGSSFVDTSASPWTYTDNVIQLLSLNKSGATATPYISGTAQTGRTVYANTAQYTTGLVIGAWGLGGRNYNGDMCEILIFNRSLSSTEMKQVHTYLGQKWGISNTDRSIIDLSGFDDNGLFGNGTVANMPDYDFYNKGALTFNGTSDYAYQSLFNNAITATLTFDVWVKFSDTGSSGRYIMSLGRDIGVPSGGIALLAYGFSSASSGQIIFEFGSGYGRVSSGIVPTTGIWYNLTVTTDGTNTRFYVNSVLANTASQTTGAVASSPGLSIGSYLNGATPPIPGTYFFNGNIGSVKIYNKTLSQAEISQNYEAQKSKFANTIVQQGLVLNLDVGNPYSYAGAGTTIYDVSATALSWTGSNVTYNSDPIKYFSYNGSNSWLQSSTSAAYDSQTITMECWCYPNTLSQEGFLFEKGSVNTQYSMFFESITNPNFVFRTMGSVSNQSSTFNPNTYLTVSAWNHIVCTYNGSSKIMYVNGVQVASVAASGTLPTGQVNQYIGRHTGGYFFNGRIAESRVYNIALSAAQVLQNYNATKGRFGL